MDYTKYLIIFSGFLTKTEATLPKALTEVIKYRFNKSHGTHLYFCQRQDAMSMVKKYENNPIFFNIKQLNNLTSPKEIEFSFKSPQVLEIFLELNCDAGLQYFTQCSDLFNNSYRWFFWTQDYENTIELLTSTRLMVDSNVTVAISNGSNILLFDIFRMYKTMPIVSTIVENWSKDGKLILKADPPHRDNFHGEPLTGSLLLTDIIINKTEDVPLLLDPIFLPGIDGNRRYGFTLFIHMSEIYNYTYNYLYTNVWGYPQKNGSWSGMIGQVIRGEAEMGLSGAHFSIGRTKVVDFVGCIDITRVCFSFLQPQLFGSYKALILPMDLSVWLCLLIITIISIIVFRIVANYDNTAQHNDSWGGSFLLVLAAISQQGIPDNTEKLSARIMYLSILCVSFFAAVYYNTSILNGLLLPAPNAIQNMDQLLASDLKIGTSDTAYLLYDMTLNDSLTIKLRKRMEKMKSPKNGVFTVKNGLDMLKKGGFALYIMTREAYPFMENKFTAAEICSLSEINKYKPFPTGGVVQNNSPFRELFNRKFTMMRERGLMTRGKLLWNPKKPECDWKQDALVIGMEPLTMAYVVISIGAVTSLIIFGTEIYSTKKIIREK